jgi:hypothetical protein
VVFVQVDLALGRLDEAIDHPQERRLPTPREPDDHEDLTRLHLEVRVVDADGRPGLFLDLGLALSRTPHLQGLSGSTPEDHRTVLYPNDRVLVLNLVSFRGLSPSLAFYIRLQGPALTPPPPDIT